VSLHQRTCGLGRICSREAGEGSHYLDGARSVPPVDSPSVPPGGGDAYPYSSLERIRTGRSAAEPPLPTEVWAHEKLHVFKAWTETFKAKTWETLHRITVRVSKVAQGISLSVRSLLPMPLSIDNNTRTGNPSVRILWYREMQKHFFGLKRSSSYSCNSVEFRSRRYEQVQRP
jgi:hypothetical protein